MKRFNLAQLFAAPKLLPNALSELTPLIHKLTLYLLTPLLTPLFTLPSEKKSLAKASLKKLSLLALAGLWLGGCTTLQSDIGTRVITCCPTANYQSFTITTADMPAFLGPIMVSNFSVALASHGLQPVDEQAGPAELAVVIRYEQENLSPDHTDDDFEEHIAMGDSLRFVAKIVIAISETDSNKLIWSGQLQRIHDVAPGEYMHTGKASVALLEAFTQVLKDFPQE